MGLLSHVTVAVIPFAFSMLACLFIIHLSHGEVREIKPVDDARHELKARGRLVYNAEKLQNNSRTGIHSGRSQKCNISRGSECTMAPERRFDCGRDKLLSQSECEERGCCYAPLPDSAGPPWCFYPRVYPGYNMGPLTPTPRGQAATLTRASPSYLPKDISTLRLDVIEETAGSFHLTVSIAHLKKLPYTCDKVCSIQIAFSLFLCFK